MARRPGRLAQRESACFTRKRSLVQSQRRPPAGVAPSSSGPGRSPLKAEIAGSNPAGATSSFLSLEWGFLGALRAPGEAEIAGSNPAGATSSFLSLEWGFLGALRAPGEAEIAGSNPAGATLLSESARLKPTAPIPHA